MKQSLHLLVLVLAVAFCWGGQVSGAEPRQEAVEKKPNDKAAPSALTFDRKVVARVEAIRFKLPGESGKPDEQVEVEFSFMKRNEKPDLSRLQELTVKKAELTPAQVDTLIQCIYGKNEKMYSAACYAPHHLFLFYDNAGKVINAVELCFSCTGLSASPKIPERQWYLHDFRRLAKLCDECGIGLGHHTAEEYSRILDAREGK